MGDANSYGHICVGKIPLCRSKVREFSNRIRDAIADYQKEHRVNLQITCNVKNVDAEDRMQRLREVMKWDRDERNIMDKKLLDDDFQPVEFVDGLCPYTNDGHGLLFEAEPWYESGEESPI